MGMCSDWFHSIFPILLSAPSVPGLSSEGLSQLALDWRAGFFREIHPRFHTVQPAEDIDETRRRVLDQLLVEKNIGFDQWDIQVRDRLVEAWHHQLG